MGCFALVAMLFGGPAAWAAPFFFSTGTPDGRLALGSRTAGGAGVEIEAADDFVLTATTNVTHATFTGLLPTSIATSAVAQVVVEIYRVFPLDSNSPPSATVPTRANSPADVAFDGRDSAASTLTFTTSVHNSSFTTANSVLNGIHPTPNQTTGGDGAVTGQEVQFDVTLTPAIQLPAGHYFFVPQVLLTPGSGDFHWLSSPLPITGAGSTPFSPDLQSWVRDANLAPNWLRVGADIVGGTPAPTFNQSFTLVGTTTQSFDPSVPTLSPLGLVALGVLLAGAGWWIRSRRTSPSATSVRTD